jgi:ParB family chromosome partitioning protein
MYIPISNLSPHPDNPRKDLGDLSELAESIRASGVLQNLIVVPTTGENDRYTVVVGHRRLAAAKLIGLADVPCSVARDMPYVEQIAVMFAENVQRADLTIPEQADCIQLMLDMGESEDGISKRTGMNKAAIRKRAKLAAYDREAVTASFAKGATLDDFAALEKIKDSAARENALKSAGTNNFNSAVKQAVAQEERAARLDAICAAMDAFAERVDDVTELRFVTSVNSVEKAVKPDGAVTPLFYKRGSYGVDLYREEAAATPEDAAAALKRERSEALNALGKLTFELRHDFAMKHKYKADDLEYIAKALLRRIDEVKGLYLRPAKGKTTVQRLARLVYGDMDNQTCAYNNYSAHYSPSPRLDAVYDYLVGLGYEMSDDEKKLRDGSHELFLPSE